MLGITGTLSRGPHGLMPSYNTHSNPKKTESAAAAKQNPKTGWALEQEKDPLSQGMSQLPQAPAGHPAKHPEPGIPSQQDQAVRELNSEANFCPGPVFPWFPPGEQRLLRSAPSRQERCVGAGWSPASITRGI